MYSFAIAGAAKAGVLDVVEAGALEEVVELDFELDNDTELVVDIEFEEIESANWVDDD